MGICGFLACGKAIGLGNRNFKRLGFSSSASNSIDAVASRDGVLRLLAAMSIFGATLSRSATDLLQWLTVEFQFLSLPDELVGSSSAMPQKPGHSREILRHTLKRQRDELLETW